MRPFRCRYVQSQRKSRSLALLRSVVRQMDHAGPKPVVVGAVDLKRGMRSDRWPVVETGRRDKRGVLLAASRAARGEGSIGVLIGGHDLTLREVGWGPAGNGDSIDLRDLQGQITRILNRK